MKKTVFIYGAGKCYHDYKKKIQAISDDAQLFIFDKKFLETDLDTYDGFHILKPEELQTKSHVSAYICLYDSDEANKIKRLLKQYGVTDILLPGVDAPIKITSDWLKQQYGDTCIYKDMFQNEIVFDESISPYVQFELLGINSSISIGKGLRVYLKLIVTVGMQANVTIGEYNSFMSAHLSVSFGNLLIGNDCMFSSHIDVRQHDGHHIYDMNTGKRINPNKDIVIENHVWVGFRAAILKGVHIGSGTVIGHSSVVTKGFGNNKLVAGCPAVILKDDICWSRDNTYYCNYLETYE